MIQREEYLEKLRRMSEEELDQELAHLQSQLGRQQQLMTRMETLARQRNELENEAEKTAGELAVELAAGRAEETADKSRGSELNLCDKDKSELWPHETDASDPKSQEAKRGNLEAGRGALREKIRQAELSMVNQGIEGANEELDEVWHSGYLYEEALKEKLARLEMITQTQNPAKTQKQEQTQKPKPATQTQKPAQTQETMGQAKGPEQTPETAPKTDPENGTASLELSWEIGEAKNRLREIKEAVDAGEKALAQADRVYGKLKNARGWGIWDILGGGLISGLVKHQRLSEAQEEIEQLQLCLRRFHTELLDVDINGGNLQADPGDFLRFADLFLDGLLFDWMVQNQIEKAALQVEELRIQLRSQLGRLKDERERTEETLEEREEKLCGQLHK